jgi:hypothetical protein
MTRNKAMDRFTGVIVFGWLGGIALLLIGLLVVATNTGYRLNWQAVGNGVFLAYIGGGLIGIGFFATLLQLTAQAVVEGVAAALRTGGGTYPMGFVTAATPTNARNTSAMTPAPANKPEYAYDELEELSSLSADEQDAWTAAGKPDLRIWISRGRPDFTDWIQDYKR